MHRSLDPEAFRGRAVLTAAALILWLVPAAAGADPGPAAQAGNPTFGGYISYWRVLGVLVAILPWLLFCQWVDKDTLFLRRVKRELWNGVVLGGGIAGLALWILMPWQGPGLFWAGFGLWFLVTAGSCGVYVAVRNSMVDPSSRVFTPRHIKAWLGSLTRKKEQKMDAVERVRVNDHRGKRVPPPTDPTQTDAFEAAQTLLFDALWRRATDVELICSGTAARLAYSIDGMVQARNDLLTPEAARAAIDFIKTVAGLDVQERRKPQQASIGAAISGGSGGTTEIEVRTSGTTQHEKLALRIVGVQNRLRIADLGLHAQQIERLEPVLKEPTGLVLVAGPRASGITTTLYAALRSHDAFMQNLLTIEQSPLMDLENITQHTYDSTKHEGSYARQLQTVLRREPDVVMVSDCLDRETAHLAVSAARVKKIYMGCVARDSLDALKRLVSLAGDTDGVADTLRAVTCQRLIRKLCIACRVAYKPDAELLRKVNLPAEKIDVFYRPPRPEEQVDEKGRPKICPNCQGSGYFGRTGLFEVMIADAGVREQIRNGQPVEAIRAAARKAGMLYMQEIGVQRVIEGVTSMNEVLRVIRGE